MITLTLSYEQARVVAEALQQYVDNTETVEATGALPEDAQRAQGICDEIEGKLCDGLDPWDEVGNSDPGRERFYTP